MDNWIKNVQTETFQDLLQNQTVYPLFKTILSESYIECAQMYLDGKYVEPMKALLDDCFGRLEENRDDINHLRGAVLTIISQVFCKQDNDFWFNQLYRHYKRNVKPQKRFEMMKPYVLGNNILDFGSGDGLFAKEFADHGYSVLTTDVLDWRDDCAASIPFVPMSSICRIPFPDNSCDTITVMAVMHHISEDSFAGVFGELRRLGKRVIIEEDCYSVPMRTDFMPMIQKDTQFQRFIMLTPEDQFRFSMLLDYFANAISQGVIEMNFPFEFRSVSDWEKIFRENGFKVQNTILLGFQKGNFNRNCHIWYVIDRV